MFWCQQWKRSNKFGEFERGRASEESVLIFGALRHKTYDIAKRWQWHWPNYSSIDINSHAFQSLDCSSINCSNQWPKWQMSCRITIRSAVCTTTAFFPTTISIVVSLLSLLLYGYYFIILYSFLLLIFPRCFIIFSSSHFVVLSDEFISLQGSYFVFTILSVILCGTLLSLYFFIYHLLLSLFFITHLFPFCWDLFQQNKFVCILLMSLILLSYSNFVAIKWTF